MPVSKGVVAAASTPGGGPPLPQSGDITATDPLGLSVGQNIIWTVDNIPPQGDKRFNPMHGFKTLGDPTPLDSQGEYWDAQNGNPNNGVFPQIARAIGGEFKFVHVALGFGDIDITGGNFDFSNTDQIQADAAAGNYKYSFQVQYKAFDGRGTFENPQPENILPADLQTSGNFTYIGIGYTGHVWQDNVMNRYIILLQAILDRYDSDPNFEGIACNESTPSLGMATVQPPGYSTSLMATQLKRMYAEVGAHAVESNFWPMMNSLGQELGGLMEECFLLRIGVGGPDAREVPGFLVYQGPAFHSQAQQDYRGKIPRLLVASFSAYDNTGRDAAAIINLTQIHQTTHMVWVIGAGGETEASIKAAIAANSALHSACPTQYLSCFIS